MDYYQRRDEEMERKGYMLSGHSFSSPQEAKEYAAKLRKMGYRATFLRSQGGMVRGIVEYEVWSKLKEASK